MPGSDGTIISSTTIFGACADAWAANVAAAAAASHEIERMVSSRSLSRLPMIDAVRPHVGRRGEAVGHVVEGGDRGDVPDVAVGEAGAAQRLGVRLLALPGPRRELDRECDHAARALGKAGGGIVNPHHLAEPGIASWRT